VETRKLIAGLLIVIILSMTALIWFFPPTGDFGVENPFWNGLTVFNEQFNALPITDYSDLPVNPEQTALIVIPYVEFEAQELEALNRYVSEGGTLIVLDDFGYGNQILIGLKVNMKFADAPLLDPLFNYKNKWLPRITDFAENSVTSNISSIVFNHASSLNSTADTVVLAYSSKFSFIDENFNALWENSERNGPLPVAAYTNVGDGYIITVADPSLIINGMIDIDDNIVFFRNLVELHDSNVQVYVDQNHLPKTALDEAKMVISIVYGAVSSPVGTLSLIALVFALSLNSLCRIGDKLGNKRNK
jgi:hypothetical protein